MTVTASGEVIVVLGLGNPLLEDDGTGLVLLAAVQGHRHWPDRVRFVDGGTWGMSLLPDICDADRLLVLDSVRTGADPGTVVRGDDAAIPRFYAHPVSPHQVDLREVLAAAELLGEVPPTMTVVGIEPVSAAELRIGLAPEVRGAVDRAVGEAVRVLDSWCAATALAHA